MPNIQLQFRRGTSAKWTAVNPVLAAGEMGIESNTNLFKIGDGVTSWTSLPYGGLQGPAGAPGPAVAFLFDGGSPSANYAFGPAFDCGGVS
jgi:hypothetical protein